MIIILSFSLSPGTTYKGGLSDYNEFNWDAEVGCSLQMNGFHANGCTHTSCQECTVGNTASPSMYGWMHNGSFIFIFVISYD